LPGVAHPAHIPPSGFPSSIHFCARSSGIAYKRDVLGSIIIQVKRIKGELFDSKEQAELHGRELCREWIDKQEFSGDYERIKRRANSLWM
jgi:hypothetical protein